jgi:hypothetical protein
MGTVEEVSTKRILASVKPMVKKLDEIEAAYRDIKGVDANDMKDKFSDVMKDPTKHLSVIRDKAEAQLKIMQSRNIGQQEWATTFKVMEPMLQKAINQDLIAPATAQAIQKGAKDYYMYHPGATPGKALALGIRGAGLAGAKEKQLVEMVKEMTTVGGQQWDVARRLQYHPQNWFPGGAPTVTAGPNYGDWRWQALKRAYGQQMARGGADPYLRDVMREHPMNPRNMLSRGLSGRTGREAVMPGVNPLVRRPGEDTDEVMEALQRIEENTKKTADESEKTAKETAKQNNQPDESHAARDKTQ